MSIKSTWDSNDILIISIINAMTNNSGIDQVTTNCSCNFSSSVSENEIYTCFWSECGVIIHSGLNKENLNHEAVLSHFFVNFIFTDTINKEL